MATLSKNEMATKLIGTSIHQGVLNDMAEDPLIVEAMLIKSNGEVSVFLGDRNGEVVIGRLSEQYRQHFASARILSWMVTGGREMDEYTRYVSDGSRLVPKERYGMNIKFRITQ